MQGCCGISAVYITVKLWHSSDDLDTSIPVHKQLLNKECGHQMLYPLLFSCLIPDLKEQEWTSA